LVRSEGSENAGIQRHRKSGPDRAVGLIDEHLDAGNRDDLRHAVAVEVADRGREERLARLLELENTGAFACASALSV
jgi:hypothetical protein